jgi:LacI family transcriptional regulator
MPVTSIDVARRAGVSQPTVSRALRDQPGMSEATRRRVKEAARELGYVPQQSGRSLSTRRSRRIGIVVGELSNPFYPALLDPMVRELEAQGYLPVLIHDDGLEEPTTEPIFDGSFDAVLLTTTLLGSSLPGEIERRGIPYVMVNREFVVDRRARSTAVPDNATGASLVADLLVDLGHRAVAMVAGPAETSTGTERLDGFRDALARRGIALHPEAVERVPFSMADGAAATARLLDRRPVKAIFCANDVLAIGALETLARRGLAVPGDVSVVGFDDIPMASLSAIDLSTVAVDLDRLGRRAVRHLADRARDPEVVPTRVVEPVELRLRGTHGPARDY